MVSNSPRIATDATDFYGFGACRSLVNQHSRQQFSPGFIDQLRARAVFSTFLVALGNRFIYKMQYLFSEEKRHTITWPEFVSVTHLPS
jgi:hypothetical protein